jgi:hypothetical protein
MGNGKIHHETPSLHKRYSLERKPEHSPMIHSNSPAPNKKLQQLLKHNSSNIKTQKPILNPEPASTRRMEGFKLPSLKKYEQDEC